MTSRSKKLYDAGEVTNLMANRDFSKITGQYIRMIKVYPKALGKFSVEDAKKEGFSGLVEFKDYWGKNISDWEPTLRVWVHEFELVKLA